MGTVQCAMHSVQKLPYMAVFNLPTVIHFATPTTSYIKIHVPSIDWHL